MFYFNAEFGARHPDREEIVRVGSVNVITLQNTYKTPTIYQAAQAQAYPQLVEDVLGTVQKILVWQKNDRLQVIIQHPLWQPVAEMLQQSLAHGLRIIWTISRILIMRTRRMCATCCAHAENADLTFGDFCVFSRKGAAEWFAQG
ncbi:MAG: hypothetical protein ACLRZH_06960 [Ruthenibacterium lactatiformans]